MEGKTLVCIDTNSNMKIGKYNIGKRRKYSLSAKLFG